MTSPEVSVVITTYNRPERIKGAIQTVLDQTFKDFEVIIVDGAKSVENMHEVLKFKDERVKYLPVEKKAVNYVSYKGIQHSRNVGCKAAKGKFIAMLDDDDHWHPEKLEKQVRQFHAILDLGLCLCHTKIGIGDDAIIDKTKNFPNYEDLLQSFNLSSTSSYLIRKDVLKEIGWWNENLRGMHEYDLALKLTKKGYLVYTIPEPLMIRNRMSNITVESGHYYFFKIAEIFDLWKYYGKDFIPRVGFKGFFFNVAKTVVLISLFSFGYIVKERIWTLVYPLKKLHEEVVA
jgi:glycosyltransferase involved in cell wall biosynthesis